MKQEKLTAGRLALPQKPNALFIITCKDRGLMHCPPGWVQRHLTMVKEKPGEATAIDV